MLHCEFSPNTSVVRDQGFVPGREAHPSLPVSRIQVFRVLGKMQFTQSLHLFRDTLPGWEDALHWLGGFGDEELGLSCPSSR